jgi:hypothetical protein
MTRAKDVKENTSNEVQYIMTRAKDVKENTSDFPTREITQHSKLKE